MKPGKIREQDPLKQGKRWGSKLNSSRNGCEPVTIPVNATLYYWGTSWCCKPGYN